MSMTLAIICFSEMLNEYSDLPIEEFKALREGLINPTGKKLITFMILVCVC